MYFCQDGLGWKMAKPRLFRPLASKFYFADLNPLLTVKAYECRELGVICLSGAEKGNLLL
jgi:hypothetical protein